MRKLVLALVALACMVPPAEAARRDERSGSSVGRQAPAAKPATAAHQAQRPIAAAHAVLRQHVARQSAARPSARHAALRPGDVRTSRGGLLLRSASAATVSRHAARGSVAGWQAGLMPADYAQRECPVGTFATLARGHENVVRCMPI